MHAVSRATPANSLNRGSCCPYSKTYATSGHSAYCASACCMNRAMNGSKSASRSRAISLRSTGSMRRAYSCGRTSDAVRMSILTVCAAPGADRRPKRDGRGRSRPGRTRRAGRRPWRRSSRDRTASRRTASIRYTARAPSAAARPKTTPTAASFIPSPSTMRSTSLRLRADRHPQPDLLRPLADGVGDDAVEPDGGEKERDEREHGQQQHREPALRDRLVNHFAKAPSRRPVASDRSRATPAARRSPMRTDRPASAP